MIFIELKPDWFTYIGKRYEQKRYVSSDMKYLITVDRIDDAKAYAARKDGTAERIYLKECEDANRFYSFEGIKAALEADPPECNNYLIIHETQFKNNAKPKL